jgi:hypothetical protein
LVHRTKPKYTSRITLACYQGIIDSSFPAS